MMLASSISATSWMLPVLPHTSVPRRDVSPLLPVLSQPCRRARGSQPCFSVAWCGYPPYGRAHLLGTLRFPTLISDHMLVCSSNQGDSVSQQETCGGFHTTRDLQPLSPRPLQSWSAANPVHFPKGAVCCCQEQSILLLVQLSSF